MKTRDCSFRGDGGREGRTRVQTSNVGVYSADGARLWRTVGGPTRQDIDARDLGATKVSWHVTTWLGPGFTKR